jgi:hypothetical protein
LKNSPGNKTSIELIVAGVSVWEARLQRLIGRLAHGKDRNGSQAGAASGAGAAPASAPMEWTLPIGEGGAINAIGRAGGTEIEIIAGMRRAWYSYELSSSADVLRALLKEGTPESRRVVLRIFANPELGHGTNAGRPWMLATLAKAGFPEAYRHYLRLLDGADPAYIAAEIVTSFAWEDLTVQAITKEHETNAARIPPLKSWLKSRIKALSARKKVRPEFQQQAEASG